MRILYVGMKYDYGKPEQGYSFEHWNFFDFLYKAGFEIIYFDFVSLMQKHGEEKMNSMLIDTARNEKPDILFSILFQHEIKPETIKKITDSGIVTINWFCDDHWRFDNFSQHYAHAFSYVTTTSSEAVRKYHAIRYKNIIKTQWACNHFLYKPDSDKEKKYDISFVGQPHGSRRDIIRSLELSGIKVHTFGTGWSDGSRVTQEKMIETFTTSKINLNLSNASISKRSFSGRLKKNSRQFLPFTLWRHLIDVHEEGQQIKGRNFEVPGCGGFMLTGDADNLSEYYAKDNEIVTFASMKDLKKKIRYFLRNEKERTEIAENGYRKTLNNHTYAHRFADIFRVLGFKKYEAAESMIQEQSSAPLREIV